MTRYGMSVTPLLRPEKHQGDGELGDYRGEDPEEIEDLSKEDIRRCTRDLLLVERAREWLLENEDT
jgi:hypothetical protein